jgi:cold shock CspA family protein
MPRPQASVTKKEIEKKKVQKRKEKEQRKEERKANAKDGKSLEDMMAYVDENGNISSTPPDPDKKKTVIKADDILIGARKYDKEAVNFVRKGKVTFFNSSKGYGFIKDEQTQDSVFVHSNSLSSPIKENDMVTFETQRSNKGLAAVNVKKV